MMIRLVGILGLVMLSSSVNAEVAVSGLVKCVVTENSSPLADASTSTGHFKVGEKFLIAYNTNTPRVTWIFPNGAGNHTDCSVNGVYLTCPWLSETSIIFDRERLRLSVPDVLGGTAEGACTPLDINSLPTP